MTETNPHKTYPQLVKRLQEAIKGDAALEAAVGGDFVTVGKLEYSLLKSLGLKDDAVVVDVGCGSGRLALQMAGMPQIHYTGTDIVPELLDHARRIAKRDDWRFVQTQGVEIPVADNSADVVCFFSVFTHLLHTDTYRYLEEAKRVLAPGGKVVFSFLEFYIYSHWTVFESSLFTTTQGDHLNQFLSRDGIASWAHHLNLTVEAIFDGDKPHIPLDEPLSWQHGGEMVGMGNLGQSVAVLRKNNS